MAGLAELLVERGVVPAEDLERARAHQGEHGGNLAQSLVTLGFATESDLVRVYASTVGMAFTDVDDAAVDDMAVALLPAELATELTALPVRFGAGGDVVVAVGDPNDRDALTARLESVMGVPVTLALAPRRALLSAISSHTDASAAGAPRMAADNGSSERPDNGGGSHAGVPDGVRQRAAQQPPTEPAPDLLTVRSEQAPSIDLDELLVSLAERGGSDLHLTVGIPPAMRINGELSTLDEYPRLEHDELEKMLYAIMTQKQREVFENDLELDMSYAIPGHARFRVNIFQQRDSIASVMRVIPFEILPLETLGVPETVSNFAYLARGFVLVTGPTGSGKSTTLASLIDLANRNRATHIMTVEDPIEFLHQHKRSVVNQREVGTDTHGFAPALKHVLRQDPDIILVGEMRDLETIQIALTAAETGHLVFGTLHTQDAPQSVDRIIDVFPPHQQEQIRVMLAGALKGVVCQTLVKTADGKGRTVACEVMVVNSGIRNLIREGKTHQIYSAMQAGAKDGMISLDQSLAHLVKAGTITYDAALEKAGQVNEFNRLVGRT